MSSTMVFVIKCLLLIAALEPIRVSGKSVCSGQVTIVSTNNSIKNCFGTVITAPSTKRQFVLTAAECVDNFLAKEIQVSVAFISGALGGHSNIAATKIIIHPNYNRSAVQKDNNIAIVHMKIDVPNLGDNPLVPNTLIDYEVDQNTQCITDAQVMQLAPKGSSDPCYTTSSDNTLVAHLPNGVRGYWAKSGYCLGSANGLVGLFSSETVCPSKGPDFHIAYYANVYKHKDWIVKNSSYLPQSQICLVLVTSIAYLVRSLL